MSATGQSCTTGFLNLLGEDATPSSPLVPLLRRRETFGPEQWIFPEMRFTCSGLLTTWIFRGIPGLSVVESCRVHLTTWRLDSRNTFATEYERVSTTERNTASVTEDESFFTYELAKPVQVEPGDIVGVELDTFCGTSVAFDNILSVNVSGSGQTFSSYWRVSSSRSFHLEFSAEMEQDFIPLIQAITGQFNNYRIYSNTTNDLI